MACIDFIVTESAIWQTLPKLKPVIHRWPEHCLVYNPLSGHTHLLEPVAGDMLAAIDQAPQSMRALCEGVAASLEMPIEDALVEQVARVLDHLDELGLIEPSLLCA